MLKLIITLHHILWRVDETMLSPTFRFALFAFATDKNKTFQIIFGCHSIASRRRRKDNGEEFYPD